MKPLLGAFAVAALLSAPLPARPDPLAAKPTAATGRTESRDTLANEPARRPGEAIFKAVALSISVLILVARGAQRKRQSAHSRKEQ